MFRRLQVTEMKPVPTHYTAAADMVTGMAVVLDIANEEAELPSAATGDNLWVVDKERIANGCKAGMQLSDWDAEYVNVAEGDKVKLHNYYPGERFATDQVAQASDMTVGTYVQANTSGLWAKMSSGTANYVVCGDPIVEANGTLYPIMRIESVTVS